MGLSNITTGGRIKRLSIRLWDKKSSSWSKKVAVWDNGQLDTNNNNGQNAGVMTHIMVAVSSRVIF